MLNIGKLFNAGFVKGETGECNINGVNFRGNNITITNESVIIDGVVMHGNTFGQLMDIKVSGNCESLTTTSGNVNVAGNVGTVGTTSGDVNCGDVNGKVGTTSGDITCKNVGSEVHTVSGDVHCDDISGGVRTVSGDIIHRQYNR